jgi:hypothetical protein
MEQNVQDHRKASFTGLNFAGALFSVLKVVLGERGLATNMASMDKFDITVVEERLDAVYGQHLEWLRTGPQKVVGTMVQWYMRVVGLHQPGDMPCWYTLNVPQCVIIRFLRFRLGCHFLRNNTGRWHHMKPMHRKCVRCEQPLSRDNEDHCLIHCQEVCIRTQREELESAIRQAHRHPAMNSMAGLFQAVLETGRQDLHYKLVNYVAVCFQVAWRCHVDLNGWRGSAAVRACQLRQDWYEYARQRESTLPLEYARLSSDLIQTDDEQEVSDSVVGPAEVCCSEELVEATSSGDWS